MHKSRLAAIWQGRCPRCGEGHIFKYPASRVTQFSKMNQRCEKCEANFEPEPGFYFGALYVSYAFTVGLFFFGWLALHFFDPPDWVYVTAITLLTVLFIPLSFRYSRILFLYWFGGLTKRDA